MTTTADLQTPVAGCPKNMVFGPCGGVGADGGCEMAPRPCVFDSVVPWPVTAAAERPGPTSAPLVLTDFSVPAFDVEAVRRTAAILAPACDAVASRP